MKQTNKLGELIASLSKREKKYLHQFLRLHSEGRNNLAYVSLYEKLSRDPFFTDAELKSKYRDAAFNGNIKYQRHYLYEVICGSLTSLYADENPNLHQKTQLGLARIFVTRKLFNHASSLANQIVNEAIDLDLGLNLIDAKLILLSMQGRAFHLDKVPDMIESMHEINEMLQQEQEYLLLRVQYYELIREERSGVPVTNARKTALLKKFGSVLEAKETALHTIRGIMQLQINTALLYSMIREPDLALKFLMRNLEEYEKHPLFLQNNLMNYMVGIANVLQISNEIQDHGLFKKVFRKVDKLPLNDPAIRSFVVHQIFFTQLKQAAKSGWYEQGMLLVKKYAPTASSFLETEDEVFLLHNLLVIAVVCFGAREYDECDSWLNRILKKRWKARPDLIIAGHLLSCLSQGETRNYEVLPGLLLTARRSLKKHQLTDGIFTALLSLLSQYDKMSQHQQITAWKEFETRFLAGEKKVPDVLDSLTIRQWVHRKIGMEIS